MREWLGIYLRGFAMGAADAVPGVSGGTIALITGIYERLVDAIAELDPREVLATLPLAARAYDGGARTDLRTEIVRMDVPFLVVLGVGVVTAAITLANVVEHLREVYPAPLFAFFFGLIAASVVVLADEMSLSTPRHVAVAVAGFVLAFVASGSFQRTLPESPAVLFLVGAVAICAMVLPGVSGSLILLTLGQYEVMTGAVEGLTTAGIGLIAGDGPEPVTGPVTTLVVFSLGALVGILTFARVVSWAFDHYRTATLTFLVALMAGALRKPATEILVHATEPTPLAVAAIVASGVVGAVAVLGLDYATGEIDY